MATTHGRPDYARIAELEARLLDAPDPVPLRVFGIRCSCGSYSNGLDRREDEGEWRFYPACQECGRDLSDQLEART